MLATDIDAEAVRVARRTVRDNGLQTLIDVIQADGVTHSRRFSSRSFSLITANILARPLRQLSVEVSNLLTPNGRLIVSGLLKTQIPMVLNAYRLQGLVLEQTILLGKWATLILKR